MTANGNTAIQAFVEAWNVDTTEERRRLVEQSWATDGVLLSPPDRVIRGQDELMREIDDFVRQWEGGKVRISEVNTNAAPGHFLYAWAIFRPDNSIYGRGIHVGERGDDGRIRRIVNFLGEPPAVT